MEGWVVWNKQWILWTQTAQPLRAPSITCQVIHFTREGHYFTRATERSQALYILPLRSLNMLFSKIWCVLKGSIYDKRIKASIVFLTFTDIIRKPRFNERGNERVIKKRRTQIIPYSWGINHSKLKVTTGRLVQCWLERPLCSLLVPGPRLISHLLAPISQSVTLPATWNLQLHLGLLKKARQPKWRRCSQWRLTCPVACCKIRGWKGWGGWVT